MKRYHLISKLSASAGVLSVCLASTAFASNTLLGLWRFDEGSGTTSADSSGAGNNGSLFGENGNNPAWVPGQAGFGNCLWFTNTAGGLDYGGDRAGVNIPANPALKTGVTPANTWSYVCWAYEASNGSGGFADYYARIFTQDGGQGLQWESGANGDSQFYTWHGDLGDWQMALGMTPAIDQWVHYALVYDGTNIIMYLNGNDPAKGGKVVSQAVAGGAGAPLDFPGYDGAFTIGTQTDYGISDGSRNWNGMIDDFAIFQGALSESEIRTIMSGDFSAYLGGPPKIVAQLQDQAVDQGLDAVFSATATSQTPMTYQWQLNGNDLPDKTDSTLTLANVQASQAGSYTVKIHNSNGTAPSRSATLTVLIPLPPQLVGLWRFDEGSGTNLADSSGLTNNGVLAAALDGNGTPGDALPTWVASQPGFGSALQFTYNESAPQYNYVLVQTNDSLKIGMTANDLWTITVWAKELSDGAGNFVSHYGRVFAYDFGWGLNFNSGYTGDVQYYIWHNNPGVWQQGFGTDAAVVPVLDQWVHLALVYDGRNLTLYKNGNNPAKSGAKTSVPAQGSVAFNGYDGSFQIGSVLNEPLNHNWNGLLDDFAIFTGALSEGQIQTVMGGDFSAFLNTKPLLSMNRSGNQVVISWTYGILQGAATLSGGWQDMPTATSPLILSPSEVQKFYRVRRAL
jgi:hypothetical protein